VSMFWLQLVNYAPFPQTVALSMRNAPGSWAGRSSITVLASSGPYATNSFDEPLKVCNCAR
jgi:hypothetical protein